jgi:hypothetical protein
MALLLLVTGQLVEAAESRQTIRTALGAAGQAITVTVAGLPLDIRSVGIIAIAETKEQVDLIPSWWT